MAYAPEIYRRIDNGMPSIRAKQFARYAGRFTTCTSSITIRMPRFPHQFASAGSALDEQGRSDFNLLQNFRSAESKIHYYVFDILALDEHPDTPVGSLLVG
jgi:ATP-dependent DNA ligase